MIPAVETDGSFRYLGESSETYAVGKLQEKLLIEPIDRAQGSFEGKATSLGCTVDAYCDNGPPAATANVKSVCKRLSALTERTDFIDDDGAHMTAIETNEMFVSYETPGPIVERVTGLFRARVVVCERYDVYGPEIASKNASYNSLNSCVQHVSPHHAKQASLFTSGGVFQTSSALCGGGGIGKKCWCEKESGVSIIYDCKLNHPSNGTTPCDLMASR